MSINPNFFRLTHADDDAVTDALVEMAPLSSWNKTLYRDVDPEAFRAYRREGVVHQIEVALNGDVNPKETDLKPLLRPGDITGIKLVSEDGEFAGRAIWLYESVKETNASVIKKFYNSQHIKALENMNRGLQEEYEKKLMELHGRVQPEGENLMLLELLTAVKFRRLGVARQLTTWGLQQANELGIPVYLGASPEGYHVYKKLGFRDLGSVTVQLEDFGGEGAYTQVAMLHDPVPPKTRDE